MKIKLIFLLNLICITAVTHSGDPRAGAGEALVAIGPESRVVFRAIEAIRDLAETTAAEVAPTGVKLMLGRENRPEPNSYYHCTKQGIFLAAGKYPNFLCTPYGEVALYGGGVFSGDTSLNHIFDRFRGRLGLKFIKNTGENHRDNKGFKVYKDGAEIKVPAADLDPYRGTDTRIVALEYGLSLYEIRSIDGELLPKAKDLSYWKPDGSDVRTGEWKTLMAAEKASLK